MLGMIGFDKMLMCTLFEDEKRGIICTFVNNADNYGGPISFFLNSNILFMYLHIRKSTDCTKCTKYEHYSITYMYSMYYSI